jgi:myo-inositol-1(or 4)-monophosphatase
MPPFAGPFASMLELAAHAARQAAQVIRRAAASPDALEVRAKRPNDFVTQIDLASERMIVDTLLGACPTHAVRSEESGEPHGAPGADHEWIVDPIDGTNNFIHGYPNYAVSIALAVRGRTEVGVVLDVTRDELFAALRGQGAWLGAQRLAVSRRATLAEAMVANTVPVRPGMAFERHMAMIAAVIGQVSALRRSGSAAIDLAWVAAGRCDAMFDRGLNAWDVAAGALLIEEAGGVVSTFTGGADFVEARECLAANPALHAELARILQPFAQAPAQVATPSSSCH